MRMAMMAITTSNSMSVKAGRRAGCERDMDRSNEVEEQHPACGACRAVSVATSDAACPLTALA